MVMGMSFRPKLNVGEPGVLEDVGDRVCVCHRERPRPAGRLIGLFVSLEVVGDNELGAVEPVVVELSPPDDHVEWSAGRHRSAHVSQRRDRVGEEHGAEAGEDVVVGAGEVGHLHVGRLEAHVLDTDLVGVRASGLDHALRNVNAVGVPFGTDDSGEPDRRVAQPAADVEDAIARLGRDFRQRRLSVIGQTPGDDVAELDPAVVEDPVPGLCCFLVFRCYLDSGHSVKVVLVEPLVYTELPFSPPSFRVRICPQVKSGHALMP